MATRRTLLVSLSLLVLVAPIAARAATDGTGRTFRPYEGPRPLAVWVQTDPWLWIIGSDTPRVALYEDGDLVFLKVVRRGEFTVRHRILGRAELDAFKVRIAVAASARDIRATYELTRMTDQPSALLYARSGDRQLATVIYGLAAEDAKLSASEIRPEPEEVFELYRLLATLSDAGSTEWQPRYIEVMLRPFEGSADDSIRWPADWPGLKSQRAIERHDSQYSIYLDASLKPKLSALLSRQDGKRGIELDGKTWAMSTRMVFPGEPIWREAFRVARETTSPKAPP